MAIAPRARQPDSKVAASVCDGQRLVRWWHGPDNALKPIAAAHSDASWCRMKLACVVVCTSLAKRCACSAMARVKPKRTMRTSGPTGAGVALAVSLDRREDAGAAHGGCKQGAESRYGGAHARRASGCQQRPRHVRCAEWF